LDILRKLRWVIYPSVFIIVFLVGMVSTFPHDTVEQIARNAITSAAIVNGPQGRSMPVVTIDDASLWRFTGVDLSKLKINWPGSMEVAPLELAVDRIRARMGVWGLLVGNKNLYSNVEMYGGNLETWLNMRKTGLGYVELQGENISLSKISILESLLGVQIAGILKTSAQFDSSSDMVKDGEGEGTLEIKDAFFGPGSLNLPAGGFVSTVQVPKISLGQVKVSVDLNKGQVNSKTISFLGGDLEAEITMNVTLGKNLKNSPITGTGWFSLNKKFIESNETIRTLFEIIPELKAANETGGKVGFALGGMLGAPRPRFQPYVSAKATAEAAKKKP
jgi:type II secretion system protein N